MTLLYEARERARHRARADRVEEINMGFNGGSEVADWIRKLRE